VAPRFRFIGNRTDGLFSAVAYFARAVGALSLVVLAGTTTACSVRISTSPMILPAGIHPPLQPESVISADLTASISRAAEDLAHEIPETFTTEDYCVAWGALCARGYVGREPIRGLLTQNRVQLRTTLHYQLDAISALGRIASCGRPDNPKRRADLFLEGHLTLDANWTAKIERAEPRVTARDECVMGAVPPARTDRTEDAVSALKRALGALPAKANEKLGPLMRAEAEKAWRALQAPIQIDERTWLTIHPEGVVATPLVGSGETLRLQMAIRSRPQIHVGSSPPISDMSPLSPLQFEPIGPRFRIVPYVFVPVDSIEQGLKERLVGEHFTRRWRFWPDPHVRIVDIHIKEAAGDLMMFGLDLEGRSKERRGF
jgi:hypothetical protein